MTKPKDQETMAAEQDDSAPGRNLLEEMLETARKRYVEEEGEEPPADFMEEARKEILRRLARKGRDEHRDVYDALADE